MWIGDGGRPTYGIVEHFVMLRWPGPAMAVVGQRQQRLYTSGRKLVTPWPPTQQWQRHQHRSDDFLQ